MTRGRINSYSIRFVILSWVNKRTVHALGHEEQYVDPTVDRIPCSVEVVEVTVRGRT